MKSLQTRIIEYLENHSVGWFDISDAARERQEEQTDCVDWLIEDHRYARADINAAESKLEDIRELLTDDIHNPVYKSVMDILDSDKYWEPIED